MGIKGLFIKKYLSFKDIQKDENTLDLVFSKKISIEEKYKVYEYLLMESLNLLSGISDVTINYDNNTITVKHDNKVISKGKIVSWVNILIDTIVENLSFIEDNWESNEEIVINKIKEILEIKKLTFK
ncbi:hypothetical protein [Clostridium sp.]|uniref:hypothetical protein n=1 Tax=Clostridium sp. TaxID=1506 RepID=UPI003F389E0C